MFTILIAKDEEKIKTVFGRILEDEALLKEKYGVLYKTILSEVEKPLIERVLERTEGNQLKAARILGINRNTIRSKIKKFGIEVGKWKV